MEWIKWLFTYIPGFYRAKDLKEVIITKPIVAIKLKNREQLDKLVQKMLVYLRQINKEVVNEMLEKLNISDSSNIDYEFFITTYGTQLLLYKDSHKEIALYVMSKLKTMDPVIYKKIIQFLRLLYELLF